MRPPLSQAPGYFVLEPHVCASHGRTLGRPPASPSPLVSSSRARRAGPRGTGYHGRTGAPDDSQLRPLPRQPGVWPPPRGSVPPAPGLAVPLTHRAASAPPTVGARNVPGAAGRSGATWWPREVPAPAAPEGTDRRGRGEEEKDRDWGGNCNILNTQYFICETCI